MNARPANFLPATRRAIEDQIERLIGLLDTVDGDENLEAAGDDEPSLGWAGNGPQNISPDIRIDDDRELEVCDEPHDTADCGDDEPWLGVTEEVDQLRRLEICSGWIVDDGELDEVRP